MLGLAVALLPIVMLVRGLVRFLGRTDIGPVEWIGFSLAGLALLLGTLFFAYSIKYYLSTIFILVSAAIARPLSAVGGAAAGPGLARINRRGPDGWSEANGIGLDLGYAPLVSIHIATYNEKRVIERLLQACAHFTYPNYEVVLVDDSTDESTEILERWTQVQRFKILHRASRDGFKGGALQEALRWTDPRAEYIVIFDADAVPFPDSLQRLLPHFYERDGAGAAPRRREDVGAVQSYQWHVLNKSESWLTQAVRAEYSGSYMVERPFQEAVGAMKMIAGTAYMIRADLLRSLGWGRSLTEDWELTLRLYLRGYKVVYTPYAETPAECVATFPRLARQRMRWAEGHTYNVRRWFPSIVRTPHMTWLEKLEFFFYSTYYLQAVSFAVGTIAWLVAEIGFKAHVPEWTALLGWSLLFSNLFALPFMNLGGLLLEGAPRRDFGGILGAIATSYLLVPFQAWAALKGLVESEEGPWYRTPKTGRITDPVWPLQHLLRLRRWLLGGRRRPAQPGPAVIQANALPPAPSRRLAWTLVIAMTLALGGLAWGALHAPVAEAAGTTLYLHGASSFTMDSTSPVGAQQTFAMTAGHIQNKTAIGTGTTITATFANAVNAGDLLVGVFRASGASVTVSDNINGAWTQINVLANVYLFYFQNSAAAAAGVMVVTLTGTSGNLRISADEFSGMATSGALDQQTTHNVNGVTWNAGTTLAIPAGELVYAGAGTSNNNTTFTAGTTNGVAMNIGGQVTDASHGSAFSEYALSSASGAQSSTATVNPTGSVNGGQATFVPGKKDRTWATTTSTSSAQTIFTSSTFTFNYWTTGASGASTDADLTFGYSASSTCASTIALVQISPEQSTLNGSSLTFTFGAASVAGHLLVATLGSNRNGVEFTAPAGWVRAVAAAKAGPGEQEIWFYANAPSTTSATFSTTAGSVIVGNISEWSGVATSSPLDQTGSLLGAGPQQLFTVSTAGAILSSGELAITDYGLTAAGGDTSVASNSGWPTIQQDATDGYLADYKLGLAGGSSPSEEAKVVPNDTWIGTIATFFPQPTFTTIAQSTSVTLSVGSNLSTATFSPSSDVVVPGGSYFCWKIHVNSVVNNGVVLDSDAAASPSQIQSSQTIFIPELALPLIGLALLAPWAARRIRFWGTHKQAGGTRS